MTTIETGSGLKTWSLFDLWIANNRPSQIVVAAYGPATCKIDGFRWNAVSGEACAAGALSLHESNGRLIGQAAGAVMSASLLALDPVLTRVAAFVSAVSLATFGVEYWTAAKWAKTGLWIRRKAWSDTSHAVRFEEGDGTAKAVAVFQGNSIAKRVVTNTDFATAEFNAFDWLVPDAPAEIDMTDSILSANGRWILTHGGITTGGGGGSTGGGSTGGGTTTADEITDAGVDLNTYCALSMTRIQLDIARAFAVTMATYSSSSRTQTDLLTAGIENIINAGGSLACAGYYRDYILSLVQEARGSSGSSGYPASQWFNGVSSTDNPSDGIGSDGDYYLLTVPPTEFIIYYKVAGHWTAILGTPF